eukprot:15141228-Alexandrium_andersonii.AAC.1
MATDQQMWVRGAKCDGCGKTIQGELQTCSTCGTCDLCAKCFPRRAELRPEHKEWQRGVLPPPEPIAQPAAEKRAPSSPSLAERAQR